jgi:hypothetical protein
MCPSVALLESLNRRKTKFENFRWHTLIGSTLQQLETKYERDIGPRRFNLDSELLDLFFGFSDPSVPSTTLSNMRTCLNKYFTQCLIYAEKPTFSRTSRRPIDGTTQNISALFQQFQKIVLSRVSSLNGTRPDIGSCSWFLPFGAY